MNILERFRAPCGWRGGAKQLSVDAVIPLIAVPVLSFAAAQTLLCTIITFVTTPILVYYLHHNFLRFLLRTKFFLMWNITSVVLLMLVFEITVVPLLEILPEENWVFVISVVGGIGCAYQTRVKADSGNQDAALSHVIELGDTGGELCTTCRRRAPPLAYHCRMCQTCVLRREYHCKWLDCCVGGSNLRWYMGCLLFSAIAFIYGSNLTMTSVCHPFIFIGTILLPDDCSDVYHQLDIALCFVSGVYSLLAGLAVLRCLLYHLWLIWIGTTANERRLALVGGGGSYGHDMLQNLGHIFCCKAC
ncbi:palmitoyltransferase ZDHHC23-B [Neodiprion pinetum]|uniref:palmitoyltransferase ZDHHC23-B n=1 Tax=Neodiprion pinetum TaxID=441929 RepID=UPI001EDF151E|nr:palmitoyltransferase ZDHHC23-B [Neodiprion pinetum]